jgi:hypothetical protein
MQSESGKEALIDMDGTLVDYDQVMTAKMIELASPQELEGLKLDNDFNKGNVTGGEYPPHLKARERLIKNQPGFWLNLPRIEAGFRVVSEIESVGFSLTVLTKGPPHAHNAWSEKFTWCRTHLPQASVTVTENKGGHFGHLLFDDWPPYVLGWLKRHSQGLVVMLSQSWNEEFSHPNVYKVDRANLEVSLEGLRPLLQQTFDR